MNRKSPTQTRRPGHRELTHNQALSHWGHCPSAHRHLSSDKVLTREVELLTRVMNRLVDFDGGERRRQRVGLALRAGRFQQPVFLSVARVLLRDSREDGNRLEPHRVLFVL